MNVHEGRLAENLVHFTRVLRVAGLPVGPGQMLDALAAVRLVGVMRREDWQAALAAVLVKRREHREVFDQAFATFWRDPDLLGKVLAAMLPHVEGRYDAPTVSPRVAQGLSPHRKASHPGVSREQEPDLVAFGASRIEQLQHTDFERMTAEEWQAVARMLETVPMPVEPRRIRRYRSAARGGIDPRATLRAAMRTGGDSLALRYRCHVRHTPPLVVLCDISGSMQRYSRMFLHWLHGMVQREPSVSVFLFGTRLTPITRLLRTRDVDAALAAVAAGVSDWSGGTRIAAALERFNQDWSRRLLAQSAAVLLVTDGLECDEEGDLGDDGPARGGGGERRDIRAREGDARGRGQGAAHGAQDGLHARRRSSIERLALAAERLSKSCRELIWLNPLLRYEGFEPKAAGVRALLPSVDRHIPVHNLAAYAQLAAALGETTRWK
ncbi:vWA domain-containing protein [Pararobbsia alpina]|uniref:VWFA domain-containing protein n=1 Tax=Pararobbsia alpina TaxID=621374 RepID=A0A6S7B800_9BURK|nr:VWA domain-containing protein [Pararobbsia alpina]CAB3780417.1 hypothetical protein LMG28138_01034 [Pararobbsia alpina]